MPTFVSSGFRPWLGALSLIRRPAVRGPASTVVWQGRRGVPSPYADFRDKMLARRAEGDRHDYFDEAALDTRRDRRCLRHRETLWLQGTLHRGGGARSDRGSWRW